MGESAAPLLEQLVHLHQDRTIHLTKERVDNFLHNAKGKLRYKRSEKNSDFVHIGPGGFVADADFPTDLESLEKLQTVFETRGAHNFKLISNLIEAYGKEGNFVSSNLSECRIRIKEQFSIPIV